MGIEGKVRRYTKRQNQAEVRERLCKKFQVTDTCGNEYTHLLVIQTNCGIVVGAANIVSSGENRNEDHFFLLCLPPMNLPCTVVPYTQLGGTIIRDSRSTSGFKII